MHMRVLPVQPCTCVCFLCNDLRAFTMSCCLRSQCIGCGKCVRQCPATFEIEASKYGRARVISQTAEPPDDIQIAIEVCPVSCIYWVGAAGTLCLMLTVGAVSWRCRLALSALHMMCRPCPPTPTHCRCRCHSCRCWRQPSRSCHV
jgi:ferredoxin